MGIPCSGPGGRWTAEWVKLGINGIESRKTAKSHRILAKRITLKVANHHMFTLCSSSARKKWEIVGKYAFS